jgi:hypothetical protein
MSVEISFINNQKLPMVVKASDGRDELDLAGLLARQKHFFLESLLIYGAILFRGFDVKSVEEFEEVVRCFSQKDLFNYAGGVSPRSALGGGAYTSTDYPPHLTLALHNELSYSSLYPQHLYFYCVIAPDEGGETTLGDSRRIFQRIPSEISDEFIQKGVLYVRNLSESRDPGYTWKDAFETDSRGIVEEHCIRIGADVEWQTDGSLKLYQRGPATSFHPQTGEQVWFNQAHGFHPSELEPTIYDSIVSSGGRFRLESYFGDGSPIPKTMLNTVREVLRNETVMHKWQQTTY